MQLCDCKSPDWFVSLLTEIISQEVLFVSPQNNVTLVLARPPKKAVDRFIFVLGTLYFSPTQSFFLNSPFSFSSTFILTLPSFHAFQLSWIYYAQKMTWLYPRRIALTPHLTLP
jgi:hypothetical protein